MSDEKLRKSICTSAAPGAIGPYAQGITCGGMIYTSGQLPVNAATGELETADIAAATAHCLENISAILAAGGATLSQVVKTTVYMTDLSEFAAMNAVYARYFPQDPPARTTVQVAALPKGAKIEIEAVAYCG